MKGKSGREGFTLLELLVVIAIIGILSTVVLASLNAARNKASIARAASDLKQINIVLAFYYNDQGLYPCFDHNWQDANESTWAAPYIKWPENPWGGKYHWEHGQQGFRFSISIQSPGQDNAQELDDLIDDGNLVSGIIRGSGGRLEYGGMDQSPALNDCH